MTDNCIHFLLHIDYIDNPELYIGTLLDAAKKAAIPAQYVLFDSCFYTIHDAVAGEQRIQ